MPTTSAPQVEPQGSGDGAPFVAERLDPRLSLEFYRRLERYMGGKPHQIDPVFRPNYERWWREHAGARAEWFRGDLLQRIQHERPLRGLHLLDFGCGTGSSPVVFAEQGATVVGLEPDEVSIAVARQRIRDCGLDERVELIQIPYLSGGTEELPLPGGTFDLVSLIGVVEHMLPPERIHCICEAHRLLKPGGELFFYDTPNRLFPFDHHTVNLWFSNWLPVPLARRYAIWRRRMAKDADFLRRGGVGVTLRAIERLLPPDRWERRYAKSETDVRNEFVWTARMIPRLWPRRQQLAERMMRGFCSTLLGGGRLFGLRPAAWTLSHVLGYRKR